MAEGTPIVKMHSNKPSQFIFLQTGIPQQRANVRRNVQTSFLQPGIVQIATELILQFEEILQKNQSQAQEIGI